MVLPDPFAVIAALAAEGLNAPTGAWCSLTAQPAVAPAWGDLSQCTYRCVVLPDIELRLLELILAIVSMHLQVRGAP